MPMNTIWRVSTYLFHYRSLYALTLGLAIGSTLFMLAVPLVIGWVIDQLITTEELTSLAVGMVVITLCFAFRDLLNCLRIRVNNTLEQRVLIDLRRDLHSKLLELPVSFYDRRKSGEIASRVIEDVGNVEQALLDGTEQGTTAIMTILGITIILFLKQPLLAVFVVAPLPLLILAGARYAKNTRRRWKRVRESSAEMNSLLVEDIQANRLIQSFSLQEREQQRFLDTANELRKRTLEAMFRWSIYSPGSNFIASLGMVAVVGMGGYMLSTDPAFTFGQFVTFFAFSRMLYEPISRMTGLNHLLSAGKASGDRVFEILDHPLEITSPAQPQPFPDGLLPVTYHDVHFTYPERDRVIKNLDLHLPAGQVTALVGHTGAGKSTIANLLLRYYDVDSGAVTIGRTDVRHMSLADLRGNIGYVAQDPFLFDGSIADNLHLARQDVSEEQLIKALQGARAWDFVSRLPQGLQTVVGERGIRLSMGEKQRITIARVLLRNPPIIIFDEATSSVDTLTERHIQEALETLMADRTVLIIAHRLSTVKNADQIVVLDHGKIVERGNHHSLIESNGRYARLWNIQHDFIPETV